MIGTTGPDEGVDQPLQSMIVPQARGYTLSTYKFLYLNTNALQQPGGAVGKFGLVKVKPASVPPSRGSRTS